MRPPFLVVLLLLLLRKSLVSPSYYCVPKKGPKKIPQKEKSKAVFVHFSFSLAEGDMMSQSMCQPASSAHRRRTDLMPTITFSSASPGMGMSRSSTPGTRMLRSPGKAVSMSRLDHLSKPRNILRPHNLHATISSAPTKRVPTKATPSPDKRKMSKSMTHLGPKKLSLAPNSPASQTGQTKKGKKNQAWSMVSVLVKVK